jgi:hypothetical protein
MEDLQATGIAIGQMVMLRKDLAALGNPNFFMNPALYTGLLQLWSILMSFSY